MALRPILLIPDPRLKQVAKPVTEITDDIRTLVKDMFETMYDAPGIGLAATQLGIMQRVIVIDCARRAADEEEDGDADQETDSDNDVEEAEEEVADPITMINPKLLQVSDEMRVHEEGCLSIPDFYEDVERPDIIRVKYTELDGSEVERDVDGLLSTCMQHEIDHLNGVLFIDHISRLKRERITKKFTKAAKRAAE